MTAAAISYVTNGSNRIQKFTSSGAFNLKWGGVGTGNGLFNNPTGIAVDSTNYVYVADSGNNRIQKFTSSGIFNLKWGTNGTGDGQFNNPQGVAFGSSGGFNPRVYVVDSGNSRVQKFNTSGGFVAKWGSSGTGDGQFNNPSGIAVNSANTYVYVADSGNNRIQKFDTSGVFIAKWGTYGTGDGQFNNPQGITIDGSGCIYVTDCNNGRIQKFDSNGNFICKWSGSGTGDGLLVNPHGLVVDSSGSVYVADSGNNRVQKFEFKVNSTTSYTYDVLGNLTQVKDAYNNTTSITYDWLSRKTAMTDPDMGYWQYGYDNNGNLTSQTDAKGQTITFTYDALNRLTGKTYPQGSGMTNVTYTYDSIAGGNFGKGQRTGMSDAPGTSSYKYDNRGRLIEEKRTADSVDYTTTFAYDGTDRVTTITLPTGETVTNTYNGRGLPHTLSGSAAGSLVTSTLYNQLGQVTEINLGNTLRTTFGYYGLGGTYDTTGGYYGKLWEIKTTKQPGGTPVLQDVKHTWDAGGNLTQREDVLAAETEYFAYDPLDRLTAVSGPYIQSFIYNEIGNITSINGVSYNYGTKPHAVTGVGSTSYTYDANGNMTARGTQNLTWDVENRPVSVGGSATFVYDGDGNRVKKTEGGETILYINRYYEKNLTTSEVTTSYYLGDRQVAQRKGTTLTYIHQDHLTGTSVMSDSSGQLISGVKFYPFGATRSGSVPTDKQFTGQRLDGTGLYYYGARYYDPTIGRFISADTVVQATPQSGAKVIEALTVSTSSPRPHITQQEDKDNPTRYINPQEQNRYSYVLNNPLKYRDPQGSWVAEAVAAATTAFGFGMSIPIPVVDIVVATVAAAITGIAYLIYQAKSGQSDKSRVKSVKSQYDNLSSHVKNYMKGGKGPDDPYIKSLIGGQLYSFGKGLLDNLQKMGPSYRQDVLDFFMNEWKVTGQEALDKLQQLFNEAYLDQDVINRIINFLTPKK